MLRMFCSVANLASWPCVQRSAKVNNRITANNARNGRKTLTIQLQDIPTAELGTLTWLVMLLSLSTERWMNYFETGHFGSLSKGRETRFPVQAD